MKNIIEYKIYRKINLINLFIKNKKNTTLSYLANILNISESTLIKDIDYLNDTYHSNIAIEKKEVNLLNTTSKNLSMTQCLLLNESKNIQLLNMILLSPFHKIKIYSDNLNISTSYTYKAIEVINQSLNKYHINIKKINNKYFLDTSSEIIFRKLFATFWMEVHLFNFEETKEETSDFTDKIKSFETELWSKIHILNLYNRSYFYISTVRESQGFHLFKAKDTDYKNENHDLFVKSLSYSTYRNNPYFENRNLLTLKEYLINKKELDQSDKEILFDTLAGIYENSISSKIPAFLFIDILLPFHCSVKKNKLLYNSSISLIKDISNILDFDFFKHESFLLYILVVHFNKVLCPITSQPVYIMSGLSKEHAYFLLNFIKNKLEKSFEFHVITKIEELDNINTNYLCVTTDENVTIPNSIIINEYPKMDDITKIKEKLCKIFY